MVDSLLLKYKFKLPISSNPRSLGLFPRAQLHCRGVISYEPHLKKSILSSQSICSSRLKPVSALSSDGAHSITREPLRGMNSAHLAVPWLGMLTGLLGNLSYFIKKRERVYPYTWSSYSGLWLKLCLFLILRIAATSTSGVIINSMKHFNLVNNGIWKSWEEYMTIAGLSALPQESLCGEMH
ncbi:maltose excess protein 1-like, chloroplastic isoform X2 [Salvia divinorum]|uniref:Maltose excess protein 1-like, chloroplastic isoform X2 n=1 Tax=Salvia divinorum TaxID=28513 RepID=A0ABD1GKY8_SALDI